MRVYVHAIGTDDTKAFTFAESVPLAQVAAAFEAALPTTLGVQRRVTAIAAAEGGRPLPPELHLGVAVADRGDLFVTLATAAHVPEGGDPKGLLPEGTAPAASAQQRPPHCPRAPGDAAAPWLVPADGAAAAGTDEELLQRADAAAAAAGHRVAAASFSRVLQRSPLHRRALMGLARVWLAAGRASLARACAQLAAEAHAHDVQGLQLLGDCQLAAGDWQAALQAYRSALQLVPPVEDEGDAVRLHLTVCCARALHAAPAPAQQEAGVQLVMGVLRSTQQQHTGALRQYATLALERGLAADAVRVLLRLLVGAPDERDLQALLARALQVPGGVPTLLAEVDALPSDSAAALTFLALAARDHGATDAAVALLREAVARSPANAAHNVALVHALELPQALDEVVAAAAHFCREAAGEVVLGGGVSLQAIGAALEGLPRLSSPASLDWLLLTEPWQPPPSLAERRAAEPAACSCMQASMPGWDSPGPQQLPYEELQLDALALVFTAVKGLFVGGALAAAWRVCQLVEPARRASSARLHTTHIRNEAAYYGCIRRLLGDFPPPPVGQLPQGDEGGSGGPAGAAATLLGAPREGLAPLYVVGDSHCLAGAWRVVRLRGQRRLLRPLLVTGCKIWHLREDSDFFTKTQFWTAMEAVPRGAEVMMVLGEIDCREGFLEAVEKLKHDDLASALAEAAAIYCGVLQRLVAERGLEVLVHPVPPVLRQTRSVVLAFTRVLQQALGAVVAAAPEVRGRLHVLHLGGMLLGEDGELKSELQLDGTHLAPTYLALLQAALDQLPPT